MSDMDLQERITQLVAEKARAVKLGFSNIRLEANQQLEEESDPGTIVMNIHDEEIVVKHNDITQISEDDLEAIVEYGICWCKNVKEKVIGRSIQTSGFGFITGFVLEIYGAFGTYFTAKRYLEAFGQERYDKYAKFAGKIFRKALQAYGDKIERANVYSYLAVAQFIKEEIINSMMSGPVAYKEAISKVTAPLKPVFEFINRQKADWLQKSKMLLTITLFMYNNIDLLQSYNQNKIALRNNEGVFPILTANKTLPEHQKIEDYLNTVYCRGGQKAELQ